MEKSRGWEGQLGGDNQARRRRWSETEPCSTHGSAHGDYRRGEVKSVEVRDTLIVVGVAVDV